MISGTVGRYDLKMSKSFLERVPAYTSTFFSNILSRLELQELEIQAKFTENILDFLCLCEFDNLLTFNLQMEIEADDHRQKLCAWLRKMHLLERISLSNFYLSFDTFKELCRGKKRLREVLWSSTVSLFLLRTENSDVQWLSNSLISCFYLNFQEVQLEYRKIIELFTICPSLRWMTLEGFSQSHRFAVVFRYYYCKFKRQLFEKILCNGPRPEELSFRMVHNANSVFNQ